MKRRVLCYAHDLVRRFRHWLDYSVVGEYDARKRQGHGVLFHLQVRLLQAHLAAVREQRNKPTV